MYMLVNPGKSVEVLDKLSIFLEPISSKEYCPRISGTACIGFHILILIVM